MNRPPYVDPNTNIIYDTDNPEYEGFLTKQSVWLKVRLDVFLLLVCRLLVCRLGASESEFPLEFDRIYVLTFPHGIPILRFVLFPLLRIPFWNSPHIKQYTKYKTIHKMHCIALQDWRRRFFLLKGSKLFYCSNEYSAPHGMIDLALCTTVKSADLKARKRNSFEISTPETTYLLYADTEQEKDDWIGRVGKAIVRCSSTYYSQGGANNSNRQQQQQQQNNLYGSMYGGHQQQSAMDSDDDDIYYEDPNNPNPYFND